MAISSWTAVTPTTNASGDDIRTSRGVYKYTFSAAGTVWLPNPNDEPAGFSLAVDENGTFPSTSLELLAAYETSDGTTGSDPSAAQIIDLGDLSQNETAVATAAPFIGLRATGGTPTITVYAKAYV